MIAKKEIVRNKRNPLHFFQALAFILKTEKITWLAVTSFLDNQGQTKLYVAANEPRTREQQNEITEIIKLFLDIEPVENMSAKMLPHHLSFIIKQFKKGVSLVGSLIKRFYCQV